MARNPRTTVRRILNSAPRSLLIQSVTIVALDPTDNNHGSHQPGSNGPSNSSTQADNFETETTADEERQKEDGVEDELEDEETTGFIDEDGEIRYPVDEVGNYEIDQEAETDESFYLDTQRDSSLCDERSQLCRSLSDQNLRTTFFLITTTNSKAAILRYLHFHNVSQDSILRKLLLNDSHLTLVEVCNLCAQNIELCKCEDMQEKCQLIFGDLKKWLEVILNSFANIMMKTKTTILEGYNSSSPINKGIFKKKLLSEMADNEMWMHFESSFDGIKVHKNGNQNIWPYSLLNLDLEDVHRASPQALILAALFIGFKNPTTKIHDRLTQWILLQMDEHVFFSEGVAWKADLTCANHDDPARRIVYNQCGLRSSGSCNFCLNQETECKINDEYTTLRENLTGSCPSTMNDGLRQRNQHSHFHKHVLYMHLCPVDLFHCFEEGILSNINTALFSKGKWNLFPSKSVDFSSTPSLPSRFRSLSGKASQCTGSEKALIFESIVVAAAFSGELGGVPSAIILSIHGLYRLCIEPQSITDETLHLKIEQISKSIEVLIVKRAPEMLNGIKVHQVLYHLARMTELYGSLFPLSTQWFEYFYHTIQRTLVPEIYNGLGMSIMRKMSALQEIKTEAAFRLHTNHQFRTEANLKMCYELGLLRRLKRISVVPTPPQYQQFCETGDVFLNVVYHDGIRYSNYCNKKTDDSNVTFIEYARVRFAKIIGMLLKENNTDLRFILKKYCNTNDHLIDISNKLYEEDVPQMHIQNWVDSVSKSSFGGRVTLTNTVVVVSADSIVGHAVVVKRNNNCVALPFSRRISLS